MRLAQDMTQEYPKPRPKIPSPKPFQRTEDEATTCQSNDGIRRESIQATREIWTQRRRATYVTQRPPTRSKRNDHNQESAGAPNIGTCDEGEVTRKTRATRQQQGQYKVNVRKRSTSRAWECRMQEQYRSAKPDMRLVNARIQAIKQTRHGCHLADPAKVTST